MLPAIHHGMLTCSSNCSTGSIQLADKLYTINHALNSKAHCTFLPTNVRKSLYESY
jgi:hypothetical protein